MPVQAMYIKGFRGVHAHVVESIDTQKFKKIGRNTPRSSSIYS